MLTRWGLQLLDPDKYESRENGLLFDGAAQQDERIEIALIL